MNLKSHFHVGLLVTLGLLGLIPAIGTAADVNFAGTWKGQVKVQVANSPPTGNGPFSGPATMSVPDPTTIGLTASSGTRTVDIIPDAERSGAGRPVTPVFAGQRGGGGGGTNPASPQKTYTMAFKVTLRIKVDKNGKWSGSLKAGNTQYVAQEWNIDGNKLTFVTIGLNGTPEYNYTAVLNDKEIHVRQILASGEPGVREFTMTR